MHVVPGVAAGTLYVLRNADSLWQPSFWVERSIDGKVIENK